MAYNLAHMDGNSNNVNDCNDLDSPPKRVKRNLDNTQKDGLSFWNHVEEYANPDCHFNKSFSFKSRDHWKLPDNQFKLYKSWKVSDLQILKSELNDVKGKLSNKDIKIWHEHTNFCNVSSKIFQTLKRNIKPELATQAWCKFFEILHRYPLLKTKEHQKFFSVHLCEAPGAFISALNHFIKQNASYNEVEWHWTGNSLNPYYEGSDTGTAITDDRLIRYTYDRWDFGSENTGNIISNDILVNIAKRIKECDSVDLVTADGSIDCQVNPSEQERMVAQLHLVEAITGVLILDPTGSLVLKMFTFYESSSVCLLYFLNCVFSKVHVFKPGTSKSGNSEVYVICENLKNEIPQKESLRSILKEIAQTPAAEMEEITSLFGEEDVPEDFIESVIECAQFFYDYQVSTINFNLKLFDESFFTKYKEELNKLQNQCKNNFFKRYSISKIPHEERIVNCKLPPFNARLIKSLRSMSFNERSNPQTYQNMLIERMCEMKNILEQHLITSSICMFNSADNFHVVLKPVFGKPFNTINVSAFCDECVLNLKNECLKNKLICMDLDMVLHCHETMLEQLFSTFEDFSKKQFNVIYVKSDTDTIQLEVCNFLQKKFLIDNISCDINESDQISTPRFYFVELFHSKFYSQPELKKTFLYNVSKILKICKEGDSLALLLEESLSRFIAGIIYIFGTVFKTVSFIHSNDANQDMLSIDVIFFAELMDVSKCALLSQEFLELSSSEINSDQTVLEILSTPDLLKDVKFHTFLTKNNHKRLLTKLWNSTCSKA